jgi:hypothetical protein
VTFRMRSLVDVWRRSGGDIGERWRRMTAKRVAGRSKRLLLLLLLKAPAGFSLVFVVLV